MVGSICRFSPTLAMMNSSRTKMFNLTALNSLFYHESLSAIESENNYEYSLEISYKQINLPGIQRMESVFSSLPERDRWNILIFIDGQDEIQFDKNTVSVSSVELENKLSLKDDEEKIKVVIKITKSKEHGLVSLYSIESILAFWSADGIIAAFERYCSFSEGINRVQTFSGISDFKVGEILFSNEVNGNPSGRDNDRKQELIDKRNDVAHFSSSSTAQFVPDDFKFDGFNENIEIFFRKLTLISSLTFICDASRFDTEKREITFRLNGYRLYANAFPDTLEFNNAISDEFYEIYLWIYSDGNIIDKIGIARNIISLHIRNDGNLLSLERGTINSIESGFQIYLKENVHQYIEVKNKLTEFIQSASEKANSISASFGTAYKTTIFSLYSFFASTFLLQILDDNNVVLINNQLFIIFLVFMLISAFIMRNSKAEVIVEIERFKESYIGLKRRYQDLLLEQDISRILDNDSQHENDLRYIQERLASYSRLWIWTLFLMFALVTILWISQQSSFITNLSKTLEIILCM